MLATNAVQITGLHIYPVKSCRGIALPEALLTERGLEWDREWMVVDEAGRFVTQRQLPLLALIETELTPHSLRLKAPRQKMLEVPLAWRAMSQINVQVWRHQCLAFDEGADAADWYSSFLGGAFRLVRFDPTHR